VIQGKKMTTQEILDQMRVYLAENNVPAENSEFIVELLDSWMTSVDADNDLALEPDALKHMVDILLENKGLLSMIQRQSAEMDALKRITLNLTASLEFQVVLDAIVQEAMQLVNDAQDAHIFLYQDGKLSFGASLFADGKKNIPFSEPRLNGLTDSVARQKETIIVEDITCHPLYTDGTKKWTGSIIGIPLKIGDRVVGVMNLARKRTGLFSRPEVRLLTLLADQAAIAIINARLHGAVRGQALSDMLTGLPNRRALDERLDSEIKRANRTDHSFSVVMMDLDGFKLINDTFGHDVGDDVLRQVAQCLRSGLRSTDFIARYGGDELTLILPDTGWPEAETVINKLQEKIHDLAIHLPNEETICLGVSGGVAVFPRHANNAPNLLRAADEALYRAKRHQRGSFQLAHRGTGVLPDLH
jgi:diguanylate cyclase (GGDEF)-like protein